MSSVSTVKEKSLKVEWTEEEKRNISQKYGCEILLENTTMELAKGTHFPNDAYIVIYEVDNKRCIDLCRGTRVRVFDLYYDKLGQGSIKSIDWGYGRVNPKLWGYQAAKPKKRK